MSVLGDARMTFELHAYSCERGVVLVCHAQVRLVGEEHDDEVRRRVELAPVALRRQLPDVLADLPRVICETQLSLRLVGRLERVEVRDERRFRVDHDVLSARYADDEIRPQGAVLRRRRHLRHVVAVLDHAGVLDDVAELCLAPAPANVRGAKCVRQAPGTLGQRRDLCLQGTVRLLTHALDRLELPIHPLERVLERPHVPGEMRLRELEEARAVRIERLRRQRLDRRLEPLVARSPLHRELRVCGCERALELDDFLNTASPLDESRAHHEEDAERAEDEADDEGDDDH